MVLELVGTNLYVLTLILVVGRVFEWVCYSSPTFELAWFIAAERATLARFAPFMLLLPHHLAADVCTGKLLFAT